MAAARDICTLLDSFPLFFNIRMEMSYVARLDCIWWDNIHLHKMGYGLQKL